MRGNPSPIIPSLIDRRPSSQLLGIRAFFKDGRTSTVYANAQGIDDATHIPKAFSIAADCLFGCSDELIAQYSRKVRWALTDADPSSRNGVAILKEWAKVNEGVAEAERGPLLQALFELREDHPVDPDGADAARDFHDDFQILSLAMHDTTGVCE